MKKKIFLLAIGLLTMLSGYAQFQSGERIVIDKPYTGDLYVAGGNIEINAAVKGDLIGAGGKVVIADTIWQDLLTAGSQITILGHVHDDVRCAGGDVEVLGTVGDDLLVFAGRVNIGSKSVVDGDLLVFGGQVYLDGTVKGKVSIYGGEVKLNGNVGKSLEVKGGEVELNGNIAQSAKMSAEKLHFGPQARIGGDLTYWTKEDSREIPDGVVQGKVSYNERLGEKDASPFWFLGGAAFTAGLLILFVLSGFLFIFVLNLLFGKSFMLAAETLKHHLGENLGFGFLYLVGLPILAIILMAIIIGLPIGLFLLAVYLFSLLFSNAVGSLLFVHYINQQRDKHWGASIVILLAVAIALFLQLISFIPIVGWLLSILVFAFAYGTLINYIIKNRKKGKG